MNIFLDLHGVLADFTSATCALFKKPIATADKWSYYENWNISENAFWKKIESKEDFWLNLEPLPWLEELLTILKEYPETDSITILTAPPRDPRCRVQTLQWVEQQDCLKNLPIIFDADKAKYASPTAFLIDDGLHNIDSWSLSPTYGSFLFPQKWNGGDSRRWRKQLLNALNEARELAMLRESAKYA